MKRKPKNKRGGKRSRRKETVSFLSSPTLPALSLAPFFARSLTLVPRSLFRNQTETLATQANAFWICIFLFRSYSFGTKTINTFIRSRSSLENPTLLQSKMGKVCTRFQTKKAQNWPHTLWGGTYLLGLYTGVPQGFNFAPIFRQIDRLLGHLAMTKARSLWLCNAYGCSQGKLSAKKPQFRLICVK